MTLISAEYLCPEHARFDILVERPAPDEVECPMCGAVSPWTISAPLYKPQRGAMVQGKAADKPHPMAMDTRELGEGMSLSEWKKKRAKMWGDHDHRTGAAKERREAAERVLHAREPK